MTDMQAAILYCQLKKLPLIAHQRKDTHKLYITAFEKLGIRSMKLVPDSDIIPFRMTALVNDVELALDKLQRISVRGEVFLSNVTATRVSNFGLVPCVNSKWLYDHGICLPIHRDVTSGDVQRIAEALQGV